MTSWKQLHLNWAGKGLINFKKLGVEGRKPQAEKRWVFQEAENVLNAITEACKCRRASGEQSGSSVELWEGTDRKEAKEVCWCHVVKGLEYHIIYAPIILFFSASVLLKIPLIFNSQMKNFRFASVSGISMPEI